MPLKVSLLGASGGIGQPLALLLKQNVKIAELALYDVKQAATPAAGVAADVSHINTPAKVKGYSGDDELAACLKDSSVVVITAGVPRKPGMTRDDLFNINAKIIKGLAEASAKHCPQAINLIITNPVNSTVPIACEVFKKAGVFDKRKIIGVTSLDVVRAMTFVGEIAGVDPKQVTVPVIGGHAGTTILPVLSQAKPSIIQKMQQTEIEKLDKKIQDAGTEVVNAKGGAGSATLSMAFAGARMVDTVIKGITGEKNVIECAFVNSDGDNYFSQPVEFGANGAEKILSYGNLNDYETKRLKEATEKLAGDIKTGIDFVRQ
jgi:malate dehydrogenase